MHLTMPEKMKVTNTVKMTCVVSGDDNGDGVESEEATDDFGEVGSRTSS